MNYVETLEDYIRYLRYPEKATKEDCEKCESYDCPISKMCKPSGDGIGGSKATNSVGDAVAQTPAPETPEGIERMRELGVAAHCLGMAIALMGESIQEDHHHDYDTYIRLGKEAIARVEKNPSIMINGE